MRRVAQAASSLILVLSACAQPATQHNDASVDANVDSATKSASAASGALAQLSALQREANALKTPLAVYAFYRERWSQAHGGLRDLIAQVLAATEAELGAYEQAVLQFPHGAPGLRSTPAPLPDAENYRAVNAADGIAQLARERRIVIVNEAHHVGQTRLLTLQLLPRLRALGYTHFAAEALDERDRDLATRGHATIASGSYVREPLYAEIIRSALKLGFVIVPYESTRADADADTREDDQARHLLEGVFRVQPDARLFVHAGYAHAHKRAGYLDTDPMALRLKRISGFDPLSIDQTLLRPIEAAREYKDYRTLLRRFAIDAPTIFLSRRDGLAWSLEPSFYDVSVVLPPPDHQIVGRPDWLTLNGERTPVAIDLDVQEDHLPCMLEARAVAESEKAVPADRVLIERAEVQAVLFLRPGSYRIALIDAKGRMLNQRRLLVTSDADAPTKNP